jgi:dTDP-4-dehydrorhamnose 3,5-epimerase
LIEVSKTKLDGVLVIQPEAFEDHRGVYIEIYNEDLYRNKGIDVKFLQDDVSISSRNVLRGIHGDDVTWKLISCLYGEFYLVVINWDKSSKQFGQWDSFVLSDDNRKQVLVPPKFGNGHLVLSDQAIFHYKQSTYYNQSGQFTIIWNDMKVNLWWPVNDPILSQRDQGGLIIP